jgi:hypothetical protein
MDTMKERDKHKRGEKKRGTKSTVMITFQMLGRTKCCMIGIFVTHAILILAIVLALVVSMGVYEDVMVQDMPGDMRRLHLEKSAVSQIIVFYLSFRGRERINLHKPTLTSSAISCVSEVEPILTLQTVRAVNALHTVGGAACNITHPCHNVPTTSHNVLKL